MVGWGRTGAGIGVLSSEAPGRVRTEARLKEDQLRMLRMSHQKCLMLGSRWGKETVRTKEAAELAPVRKDMRVVVGVGSGVTLTEAAMVRGEGARGV
jgi:hypothetical protein